MLCFARRLQQLHPVVRRSSACQQLRSFYCFTSNSPYKSRRPVPDPRAEEKSKPKSEWWVVDGEIHEIGEDVPHRERFRVVPYMPAQRRKWLREQFMRRTRLFIKERDHESWCRRYTGLYQELRENWERLYWDEGYSNKLAEDHANYDSAEDDDQDFSPYRRGQFDPEQVKGRGLGSNNRRDEKWVAVSQSHDKFVFDRERGVRGKAFAPIPRDDVDWHGAPKKQEPCPWKRFD